VLVDHGLLREGEAEEVARELGEKRGLDLRVVDARERFLSRLAGVTDPEQKRKIIGAEFIGSSKRRPARSARCEFLAQGTLYPDVIESASAGWGAQVIKSHHNVGGLPERMHLKLVEPVRRLFKDEVRELGRELGLPAHLVDRHPFPGPGLAVRTLGAVNAADLAILRHADAIFIAELRRAKWYHRTWQAFAVLLPVSTVGVKGDERSYEKVIALRAVNSSDGMTAGLDAPARLPAGTRGEPDRNEVRGVNPRGVRLHEQATRRPSSGSEWSGSRSGDDVRGEVVAVARGHRADRGLQRPGARPAHRSTAAERDARRLGAHQAGSGQARRCVARCARRSFRHRDGSRMAAARSAGSAHARPARRWGGDRRGHAAPSLRAGVSRPARRRTRRHHPADSLWHIVARLPDIWQWEAVRTRADLALVRRDTVLAYRVVEQTTGFAAWPDGEAAAFCARKVALCLARRDTVGALATARFALQRYPADSLTAAALHAVEPLIGARHDTLTTGELVAAATGEESRGDLAAAARRLDQASARSDARGRHAIELKRAMVLRRLNRFGPANEALERAMAAAATRSDSAACELARARVFRDQGDARRALLSYQKAAASLDSRVRMLARRERADVFEDRGEWAAAAREYHQIASLEGPRFDGAIVRGGVMFLAAGEPDSALRMWERSDSDGATFWRGCVLRARDRSAGDSLLHIVASAPGFTFYRTAARESLGLRGWPASLKALATYPEDRALRMARTLLALGMNDDAAFVLERWAAGDPRAELVDPEMASMRISERRPDGTTHVRANYPPVAERPAAKWLAAAAIAYAAGFPRPRVPLQRSAPWRRRATRPMRLGGP
jgi:GMP synthase (glutamine-hydrolysing) B subunit